MLAQKSAAPQHIPPIMSVFVSFFSEFPPSDGATFPRKNIHGISAIPPIYERIARNVHGPT